MTAPEGGQPDREMFRAEETGRSRLRAKRHAERTGHALTGWWAVERNGAKVRVRRAFTQTCCADTEPPA